MDKRKNLNVYTSDQSHEEASRNGRKGGIASGKARREKKLFRETLQEFLKIPVYEGMTKNIEEAKSFAELKNANLTMQEAVLFAQIKKAVTGDTRAAEYIRDTIGEKPAQSVDMNAEVTSGDFTLKVTGDDDADD